jgi:hypothetical protein
VAATDRADGASRVVVFQVKATFNYPIPSWAVKCTATSHITGKGEC